MTIPDIALILYAVAQIADVVTTLRLLGRGGVLINFGAAGGAAAGL